jgi:hypothetical protein
LRGKKDFLLSFAQFYKKFFDNSAEAVEMLADIQKNYRDEYNKIREFSSNPDAITELINKLSSEKKGILLNLLFRAGEFGNKMSNLFESEVKEKLQLAKELREFAAELSKSISKD